MDGIHINRRINEFIFSSFEITHRLDGNSTRVMAVPAEPQQHGAKKDEEIL